jgi:uncharacterized protein YbgA (DUF1722 family)
MAQVRVADSKPGLARSGVGLYAAALMKACPNLPIEEEGRLHEAGLRENFIERIFAYRRLCELFRARWSQPEVIQFHSAHELQLMAHSPKAHGELKRLVASIQGVSRASFRDQYERGFMAALARSASRGRIADALNHAAGHLAKSLDAASRTELANLIDEYRGEEIPLVVPLSLLRHYVRRYSVDSLRGQVFLEPHPEQWRLRHPE